MSWVTSTSVRPARRFSRKTSMHFCANAASPTASTSSIEHDVGVGLDHHREREPHHHPRRVVLQLEVGELAQLGEVEHRVEPAPRLAPAEAHHHAVEHDVLARRELGVEADAELDERRQPPGHADPPGVGAVDARHDLQQRALAGAVAPDDPEELALVDVEGDAAQRAQLAVLAARERMQRALLERVDPLVRDAEGLLDPAGLDDDGCGASGSRSVRGAQTRARQRRSRRCSKLASVGQARVRAAPDAGASRRQSDARAASSLSLPSVSLRPASARSGRAASQATPRRALGGDEALAARAACRRQPAPRSATSRICASSARGR